LNLDPSAFLADPELVEALDKRSTPIACNAGDVLFQQGDEPNGIYILDRGEATLTMISDKGETVMHVKAPAGSLLGLPGLIGNQPYSLTAVVGKDTQCKFVPRAEFTRLMQSDPMLSLKILQVLAAEVRSARRAIANL